MQSLADSGAVGLIVKGRQAGLQRGYRYVGGGVLESDRQGQMISSASLAAAAAAGAESTWTVVPAGSQTRLGVDRDLDGFFDRDELDAGSDPDDAASVPTPGCDGDSNGDGRTDAADLSVLLATFGQAAAPGSGADFNADGMVDAADLSVLLADFGCVTP